jgi:hypothetical protein
MLNIVDSFLEYSHFSLCELTETQMLHYYSFHGYHSHLTNLCLPCCYQLQKIKHYRFSIVTNWKVAISRPDEVNDFYQFT